MKKTYLALAGFVTLVVSCTTTIKERIPLGNSTTVSEERHLFMDVHNLVSDNIAIDSSDRGKNLAAQSKYGVHLLKYWIDEVAGKAYCLAESGDSSSIYQWHKDVYGLVPDRVLQVKGSEEAARKLNGQLFLDVHRFGAVKVTSHDVVAAHQNNVAAQHKYHVNLLTYWSDEKHGVLMCLAEAPNAEAMIKLHKETQGFIPDEVHLVKEVH